MPDGEGQGLQVRAPLARRRQPGRHLTVVDVTDNVERLVHAGQGGLQWIGGEGIEVADKARDGPRHHDERSRAGARKSATRRRGRGKAGRNGHDKRRTGNDRGGAVCGS